VNRPGLNLDDLRNLSRANVLTSGIPALYYRLLKTDQRTRMLANSQVRITDGTQAKASFGQDIPIPRTVISPIQQGGIAIQPQTTFEYQTVGVNILMTPRAHANDDVSLALDIGLSTLAGTLNDLPIIGTRQVVTSIRLRDGETNILGGLIREDERTSRETIPGLGDIPVLGKLFARNRREAEQTDVVVLLTPHIVRGLSVTEDDLRPFLLPRDSQGGGLIDLGPAVPPPPIVRDPGGRGGALVSFPVTPGVPTGVLPAPPLSTPPGTGNRN
jgi:general secretion pathway protein D